MKRCLLFTQDVIDVESIVMLKGVEEATSRKYCERPLRLFFAKEKLNSLCSSLATKLVKSQRL